MDASISNIFNKIKKYTVCQ